MAKQSGLGVTITVDDASGTPRDISNDINSFTASTPRAVQEVTGVDKSAMERLLLLGDATIAFNGTVNTATNKSHDVFKTVTSSSVPRTVVIDYGDVSLTCELLFTDYSIARGADGSLTWTTSGVLADGVAPVWGT